MRAKTGADTPNVMELEYDLGSLLVANIHVELDRSHEGLIVIV